MLAFRNYPLRVATECEKIRGVILSVSKIKQNGIHLSSVGDRNITQAVVNVHKTQIDDVTVSKCGRYQVGLKSYSSASSVREDEVGKFERMSGSWWNQSSGQMKELHSMNKLRIPFVRDGLLQQRQIVDRRNAPKPLEGFEILDVGCGGGILCEPLARLGASVKGIDPGKENIAAALQHRPSELQSSLSYECQSLEDLASLDAENQKYDAVVMSEVIEHIEVPEKFIETATCLLKPGGSLFLTTLNRTPESWLGAIVAWEYLLRRLPTGTHDWRKFLSPAEVDRIFKTCGLQTVLVHGMCYNPVNNIWKWSSRQDINYAMQAIKL